MWGVGLYDGFGWLGGVLCDVVVVLRSGLVPIEEEVGKGGGKIGDWSAWPVADIVGCD
jgi:hypothetical protein